MTTPGLLGDDGQRDDEQMSNERYGRGGRSVISVDRRSRQRSWSGAAARRQMLEGRWRCWYCA